MSDTLDNAPTCILTLRVIEEGELGYRLTDGTVSAWIAKSASKVHEDKMRGGQYPRRDVKIEMPEWLARKNGFIK